MKKLGLALILGAMLYIPTQAERPGSCYALIIGVNNYTSTDINPLKFACADAEEFKKALATLGNFPEANIFLMTTDSPPNSTSRPNANNIVFRLDKLAEELGPNDTLVFYFAGHGMQPEADKDQKKQEIYLLGEDADVRSDGVLKRTALSSDLVLGDYLNDKIKARRKLIVLDACRNDPKGGSRSAVQDPNPASGAQSRSLVKEPKSQGPGFGASELEPATATLFACGDTQRSWEWGEQKHGYFTYFLVDGLKKAKTDSAGHLTLQSLVSYVQTNVKSEVKRQTGETQEPMFKYYGQGPDRWVLATRSATPEAPDPKQQEIEVLRARAVAAEESKKAAEKRAEAAETKAAALQAAADFEKTKLAASKGQNGSSEEQAKLLEEYTRAKEEARLATERSKAAELRAEAAEVSKASALAQADAAEAARNNALPLGTASSTVAQTQLNRMREDKEAAEKRAWDAEQKLKATRTTITSDRANRTTTSKMRGKINWGTILQEGDEANELPPPPP